MKKLVIVFYSRIAIFLDCLRFRSLRCLDSTVFLSKFVGVRHNNVLLDNASLKQSDVVFNGVGNSVSINGRLWKTEIFVTGNNNRVEIKNGVGLNLSKIVVRGNGCSVSIGEGTTFGSAYMVCMGNENSITIGSECMFAENIEVWNTDSHPIFDADGRVINHSKSIAIGNHVWCGKYCKILKGVTIGDGAVIGMQALVTKNIEPNTLNVGIPATAIRKGVNWDRNFIQE